MTIRTLLRRTAPPPRTLGQVVRARRLELHLTQVGLAERMAALGDDTVDHSWISHLERDRVALPRNGRLQALAAALGIPSGELLSRSGWDGAERVIRGPLDTDHALRMRLAHARTREVAARHAEILEQCRETHGQLEEALNRWA